MADTATPEAPTRAPKIERYVRDALRSAGISAADLTEDQRQRALDAPAKKAGLKGKAVSLYVLEGTEANKNDVANSKATAKPKKVKAERVRRNTNHPEWVADAVRRAKAMSAQKPGLEDANHVPAAGPIQHIKVRAVVTKAIESAGGEVTRETVLEQAGVPSVKALKDIATFKSNRESLKPLRAIGSQMNKDGWAKGRYLAAILAVWAEDLGKS